MLRTVKFTGKDVGTEISIWYPSSDGFVVRSITGLDAGSTNLHISELATLDGGVFGGVRKSSREIVFEFGYGPALPPQNGREISYTTFPLGEKLNLRFVSDNRTVEINGYVETNEATIFDEEPGFQVVVICPEVYFRSMPEDRKFVEFANQVKKFEFPFSNNIADGKTLIMGDYLMEDAREVYYDGHQETGVIVTISAFGALVNPIVYNQSNGQSFRINTDVLTDGVTGDIRTGDVIKINTIRGQRSLILSRNGEDYNIINAKSRTSNWLTLKRGLNKISISSDSSLTLMNVLMESDTLYAGL